MPSPIPVTSRASIAGFHDHILIGTIAIAVLTLPVAIATRAFPPGFLDDLLAGIKAVAAVAILAGTVPIAPGGFDRQPSG